MASFSDLVKMARGAISILLVALLIPAYGKCVKSVGDMPILGRIGNRNTFLFCMAAGNILMAVGIFC